MWSRRAPARFALRIGLARWHGSEREPFPHSRLARFINRWILLRTIRRWLGRAIGSQDILWAYFPSPLNADLFRLGGFGVRVYQLMSSAEAVRVHSGIAKANEIMLRESTLVFANSRRLREQAGALNPRAYLFRAGVNLEVFEQADRDDRRTPPDLTGLAGPLIGYVGALHQWVDLDLLQQVAVGMPDCRFVLVGPLGRNLGALRNLPNVRWIGQKAHGEIPSYVRHFDVCVIPYVRDAYTATAYPAKLNEYLALGKPVVATPLSELVDYNQEYGKILHLAGDAPAFIKALRQALVETTPAMRDQYRHVARQNSWAVRVEEMSHLVEEVLHQPRTSNLERL
jgi:glycosyltransferase involved in cell wall biosynthesis